MAQVLHINAFKMNQKLVEGKTMFTSTIKVKYLVDETYFTINWWDKDLKGNTNQGYQRKPENDTRKKKIAKYFKVSLNPIFPTNIVVVARQKLDFKKNYDNLGSLELNGYPLYILDGQNRIDGFKYAAENEENDSILEYDMPVTILSGFELIDEVEQFYILNSEQKKVKTDLAQRLRRELHLTMGEDRYTQLYGDNWEMRALPVLDLINASGTEKDNVWLERIYEPNTKKKPGQMISQNSFLSSTRPLFKTGAFEGILADKAYEALNNYWKAVRNCFPEAFAKPRDYVIQKTPGVFSLHNLANVIFKRLSSEHKEWSEQNIHELLKRAFRDDYDSNFWMSNFTNGATLYGSMKGFKMLADHFISNIDK